MDWVNDTLKYDHDECFAAGQLRARPGEEGRAIAATTTACAPPWAASLGYPTRIAYGINPFPKNSPSHCKLEAFLPPYGWVGFDVSETQKLISRIQQGRQARRREEGAT